MQGNIWNLLMHVVEENGKDVQYFGNAGGGGVFVDAILYALVGFAVTFLGIAILILLVWVVGKIINGVTGKIKAGKKAATATETVALPESDGVSEEIRVAIIAAISAYYMNENSHCEFKVKRIKRI